jgi:GT2 family glycosyltransferase
MKTTIAIPNFNGKGLLERNLPNIISSGADEVLVIDDGSSDQSVEFIRANFPTVKLLVNKKNQGFIYSVNRLFEEAEGEIVVLLNSDVLVSREFLKPLLVHFKDKQVFAVNCHEQDEAWSDAFWSKGFFEFKRGDEKSVAHRSSWASGGSAAYRKEIWKRLGGFDELFAPFYWEDVDLSYRAIKAGFDVLWEPEAKVTHEHETTISKVFKKRFTDWVKQRNQLLFIWKNIDDKRLIGEHRKYLIRRLFGGIGLGYWVPFIWALIRYPKIKRLKDEWIKLKDREVIDYVRH